MTHHNEAVRFDPFLAGKARQSAEDAKATALAMVMIVVALVPAILLGAGYLLMLGLGMVHADLAVVPALGYPASVGAVLATGILGFALRFRGSVSTG